MGSGQHFGQIQTIDLMWYQLLIKHTKYHNISDSIYYRIWTTFWTDPNYCCKIVPINHKHTNIKYFDFIYLKIKVYHTQLQIYIQL